MKILTVCPDEEATDVIKTSLRLDNHVVTTVRSVREAEEMLVDYDFDAVIARTTQDDGKRLVRVAAETPVVAIVTADRPDLVAEMLDAGAADALCRPVDARELLARVRLAGRRSLGRTPAAIDIDGLIIDTSWRTVSVKGDDIHMSDLEYRLLEALAMRRGRVVSRETLLQLLYDDNEDGPGDTIFSVVVYKIRQKIRAVSGRNFIETINGRGYRLTDKPAKYRHIA